MAKSKATPPPKPWPRLSVDLSPRAVLHECRSCGGVDKLARWLEHDENDTPEPIVVVLCGACADRIIEPHPRLYRRLDPFEPFPGAMHLCVDCIHRDGCRCTNPKAQINGGPGLTIKFPPPIRAHVCRSPRHLSGYVTTWTGPVSECDGRELKL